MVMRNAATGRSKTDLPALYDELEAKIRALESLGWTQDKTGRELEIIEKIKEKGENTYFLPHRPIVKDDKITTKIQPVFDASPRATGQSSLNELLYKGPNLIEQIPDILDRFRRYPIGLYADIEKAFLQLGITLKHRDFLRFFYPDEGNCVTKVNSISQQEEFVLRSKEILSRGCFNLRKWESTGTTELLGIIWYLDKDTLKCKIYFEGLSGETKITKRLILVTVQKLFDPIGMLCSLTRTPKILLSSYARKFSKFHSILRLVALVLRFLNNVRSRISDKKKGQLSLDEL
ncbi:uncharacterized protein TNCV_3398021 [Trichonephila clavipes]|nr:uncharacterized protein TNCV_3398021 [Trichonephila clavipes]